MGSGANSTSTSMRAPRSSEIGWGSWSSLGDQTSRSATSSYKCLKSDSATALLSTWLLAVDDPLNREASSAFAIIGALVPIVAPISDSFEREVSDVTPGPPVHGDVGEQAVQLKALVDPG